MKPSLYAELQRRNVIRAGLLYIGAIWALAQGVSQIGPAFGMPDWGTRWFVTAGLVGFPFWLAFAWFFELTPEGLKLESSVTPGASITPQTGRRMDFLIIGVLGLAVVLLITDRLVHRGSSTPPPAAAAAPDKSVAVLPFANLSSDKEQEYFSDGIAEDLLNLLAKVQTLHVAARTSSFYFKGKNVPIAEIASTLHVANVLEGSVRKSGEQVRISAQLVRASDGYQIWSQTWDRKLDDVFTIQDEIAAAVVSQLKVKLLGEAPVARPVDPRVYPLILQAEALSGQQSGASRKQAVEVFQQALAVSPDEPRAWAGLARVYFNQAVYEERSGSEGALLARQAADKALAIDSGNVLATAVLGRVAAELEQDPAAAARYYQRALERDASDMALINAAGVLLMYSARFEEARRLFEYRVAHDPANATAWNNLGSVQYAARQWDASIESLRTTLRLSPGYSGVHNVISNSLLQGRHDAAAALKEAQAETDEAQRLQAEATALHSLGRAQESDAALQALIDKYGQGTPASVAQVYAWRGQADLAFQWLDRAAAAHDPNATAVLSEVMFDSLHSDPRWLPFLRKIGYAPEQLAKIEFKVMLPEAEAR